MGYAPEELTLAVYVPLRDGVWTGMLDEDDGASFGRCTGAYLHTRFRMERSGGRIVLSATATGNGFPEFRRKAFRIRVYGRTVNERVIKNHGTDFTLELADDALPDDVSGTVSNS
jgi:hypothetical protein